MVLIRSAPQGLVALAGLRTLGFGGVAPIGAYSPSRSQQSKEYNLQHKRPRALHPPPRYCTFIHGHCGISSQGATVCASKCPWYVPPRSFGSSHGIVVFPPKVLRSGYPRVRGCTLPKEAQFLPRCCSMRFQVYVVCTPPKELRFLSRDSGIPSKGAAIWVPTGTWMHAPQGSAVPPKAL